MRAWKQPDAVSRRRILRQFSCGIGCSRLAGGSEGSPDVSLRATVAFGLRPDGGFGLLATIEVSLPGISPADAERRMEAARHICSICDATREEVLRCKLL